MKTPQTNRRAFTMAVLTTMLGGASARAQQRPEFPNQPVRLVVAFPPGQAADVMARLLGEELQKVWGQPIVVLNSAGGNSIPGTVTGRNAPADGYTITFGTSSSIAVNPGIYKDLPYAPAKDFAMVHGVYIAPIVIVAHHATPFSSLEELVRAAKAKPGSLQWGYGSSSMQLAAELFKQQLNVNIQGIPYKGSGPAMTDLVGGHIPLLLDTPTSVLPQLKAGKIKALAIMTAQRITQLPEVPTVAESGYPGFEASGWGGLVVPAATPAAIIQKIGADVSRIMSDPAIQQKMIDRGVVPDLRGPKEWSTFVNAEIRRWTEVAHRGNVKAD